MSGRKGRRDFFKALAVGAMAPLDVSSGKPASARDTNWHHFSMTYDGNDHYVAYVDGEIVDAKTYSQWCTED